MNATVLLPWAYEPGLANHTRVLFVVEHKDETFCLYVYLEDAASFPYHRDDRAWALKFQLEKEQNSAYHENLFQFIDKENADIQDYLVDAMLWAEKHILSPMDILALSL